MLIYSQSLTNTPTNKAPKGYHPGYVILNDSIRLEGLVRNDIRHKATIQILQQDGRKTTYTASQLREAVINQTRFATVEGEWYSILETGSKLNLLQKASAVADRIQFNGTEPVGASSSRGGYNDLFLQASARPDTSLIWITAANAEIMVRNLMAKCSSVMEEINGRKVSLKELQELVRKYNACQ